jgi:sugar transferase (PEP-CTERM system associated)
MMPRNRSRILSIFLVETLLGLLCIAAGIRLRFGPESNQIISHQLGWVKAVLLVAVFEGSFYIFGLYDLNELSDRTRVALKILAAAGAASISMAIVFYLVPELRLGRGVYIVSVALLLAMMLLGRLILLWVLFHPRLSERIIILGTGASAIRIAKELLDRKEYGYKVLGFLGDDPALIGKSLINPRVIGLTSDLEGIVLRHRPDRLIVAEQGGTLSVSSLLNLELLDLVPIEDGSSFYERLTGRINTQMVRPSWLIFSGRRGRLRVYREVRRIADVLVAVVGLLVSIPVMLLAAIAIKLDSAGPIFYTQERVGRNNRPFKIIKFRSMRTDAEANGPVWAGQADGRVTRVGRVMRKLRIDELPQFLNVIRGEMSFIGPRPERPVFVEMLERHVPFYSQRHLVKPGLTGWAQIRYPYGASVEDAMEKLQYDLYYIKNQSPLLDVIILFETVRIVLFGRGAR